MAACRNSLNPEYVAGNLVRTLCHIMKNKDCKTLCRGGVQNLVPNFIHKYENSTYGPCAGQPCAKSYRIKPCAYPAGAAQGRHKVETYSEPPYMRTMRHFSLPANYRSAFAATQLAGSGEDLLSSVPAKRSRPADVVRENKFRRNRSGPYCPRFP